MKKLNKKKLSNFIIVVLFFIATVLRIIKMLNFDTLAGDEGIQLLHARHAVLYSKFPYAGEISALDSKNQFIFIKPPHGNYFQFFLYIIGGLSIEGYLISYIILNLLTILFLYKSATLIFSKKAALLTLAISLFAQHMLHYSVWTSQVVNTIFIESLSIYLFALFYKKQNSKYLVDSFILSFLSTQIYTPILLLFPGKIHILSKNKNTITKQNWKRLFLGMLLIAIPTIFLEFKTNFHNLKTIQEFIIFNKQSSINTANNSISSMVNSFIESTLRLGQYINTFFSKKNTLGITIWSFILYSLYKFRNKKKLKILFIFILTPFLIFVVINSGSNIAKNRAYIDIFSIYFYFFIAALFSYYKKYFYILILCLITLSSTSQIKDSLYPSENANLYEIKKISKQINDDINMNNLSFSNIDIFTSNPNDRWSWDNTIYWYVLEEKHQAKLVDLDVYSSKIKIPNKNNIKKIYLICSTNSFHFKTNIIEESIDCKNDFENKIHDIYKFPYIATQKWTTKNTTTFVYKIAFSTEK